MTPRGTSAAHVSPSVPVRLMPLLRRARDLRSGGAGGSGAVGQPIAGRTRGGGRQKRDGRVRARGWRVRARAPGGGRANGDRARAEARPVRRRASRSRCSCSRLRAQSARREAALRTPAPMRWHRRSARGPRIGAARALPQGFRADCCPSNERPAAGPGRAPAGGADVVAAPHARAADRRGLCLRIGRGCNGTPWGFLRYSSSSLRDTSPAGRAAFWGARARKRLAASCPWSSACLKPSLGLQQATSPAAAAAAPREPQRRARAPAAPTAPPPPAAARSVATSS
jgi:hypothetical protein